MSRIRGYIRRWSERPQPRPWVRPWALLAPVAIILISLLFLRPLRFPAHAAPDELIRLETIQAIGERKSFSIARVERKRQGTWQEGTVSLYRVGPAVYSGQPPMMASLLGGAYWVMNRWGLSMRENPVVVMYLLTLLGTTIPAAASAGLIYRMARMFELPRAWRSLLSFAAVMGSGLGTYAVVLNAHVPAATLILGAGAAIIHWARSPRPFRALGWLSVAGLCAAAASTLDPMCGVFLILLLAPIFTLRVGIPTRLAGALLYFAGSLLPLVAHCSIALRLGTPVIPQPFVDAPIIQHSIASPDDDGPEQPSLFQWKLLRMFELSLGVHGILVHFPLLFIGVLGIASVMHRHWPLWLKTLAATTGVGAVIVFLIVALSQANLQYGMYSCRWLICFSPLLILSCGGWLKRTHSKGVRVLASICLIFSILAGFIGMLHPWPTEGYGSFTMVDVFSRLSE